MDRVPLPHPAAHKSRTVVQETSFWRFPAWAETHAQPWRWRQALIQGALDAFASGKWHEALLHLDPCCSMPVPAAEDLLLRSEVYARLGQARLAQHDLQAAHAIDPNLPAIQLRMLNNLWRSSGDAEELVRYARRLVSFDTAPSVLQFCLRRVLNNGSWSGVALAKATHETIRILVLTAQQEDVLVDARFASLRRQGAARTRADHSHASVLGFATTLELAWPAEERHAALASAELKLWWPTSSQTRPWHTNRANRQPVFSPAGERDTASIIIPVYDGLTATRACLDSVLSDGESRAAHRLVLVDDRGPDPRVGALLQETAARARSLGRRIEILRNPSNLGFIGSVNHALSAFPAGPVILLNADTLVGPGWIDRMLQAARHPKVGTVTALSNNGEVTSLPEMFVAAPMPDLEAVRRIDATVARNNQGQVVDIPNGVGFCMLITPAARAACGFLNDLDYQQGYLEEVDYCLRAAESGLRNVCACDVFVGHEGGKSFKDTKRALVVRNLGELERRFPAIRRETLRFQNEDPLASVREAFQLAVLRQGIGAGSVILEVGANRLLGTHRLHPQQAGVITVTPMAQGAEYRAVRLESSAMLAPSQLDLAFGADEPMAETLAALFSAFRVSSILFTDTTEATHPLFDLPHLTGAPYDLRLTHGGFADKGDGRRLVAGARMLSTISPTLVRQARALGRDDVHLERHRSFGVPIEDLRIEPEGPGFSIAAFCEKDDPEAGQIVLSLARLVLARQLPLRIVLFGRAPSRAMLATGCVAHGTDLLDPRAADLMALNQCRVSLCLIRTDLYEHPVQDLLVAAPRPLFTFSDTLTEPLALAPRDIVSVAADAVAPVLLDRILEMVPDQSRVML